MRSVVDSRISRGAYQDTICRIATGKRIQCCALAGRYRIHLRGDAGGDSKLVWSPPGRSLVVLGYPDIYQAGDHVPEILQFKPIACEAIDACSLKT